MIEFAGQVRRRRGEHQFAVEPERLSRDRRHRRTIGTPQALWRHGLSAGNSQRLDFAHVVPGARIAYPDDRGRAEGGAQVNSVRAVIVDGEQKVETIATNRAQTAESRCAAENYA